MTPLEQWARTLDGRFVDLDGSPAAQPYQCHDVWLDYLDQVLGGSIADGYAPGDATIGVWQQFGTARPALAKLLTKHHGIAGIRAGDVVFWPLGTPAHPDSHVAVALGPVDAAGSFPCLTQNPGPATVARLAAAGAAGYLRPIHDPKDEPVTEAEIKKIINGVLDTKVPRAGTDAKGNPRKGSVTLRYFLAHWEDQEGISRRIDERIARKLGA